MHLQGHVTQQRLVIVGADGYDRFQLLLLTTFKYLNLLI